MKDSLGHRPYSLSGRGGVLIVLLSILALRLFALNDFPLLDPSEGRYAEIAQSMAASNQYVMPEFRNGEPFWGKPPVYFWAAAGAIELFGATPFAVRLPSLVFSILTAFILFLFARRRFGERVGWVAILLLSTSLLFLVLAGLTLVDSALMFFVALALYADLQAHHSTRTRGRARAWLLMGAFAIAGALLAKGLIAILIIFPALAARELQTEAGRNSDPALTVRGTLRRITSSLAAPFSMIMAGIVLSSPWHLLAELNSPGFLRYYILGEHFLRFIQPGWESLYGDAHIEPLGSVWLYLAAGLLPWSILVPLALWKSRVPLKSLGNDADWGLLAWAVVLPAAFTVTKGVMVPYVLPVIPAWSLLFSQAVTNAFPKAPITPFASPSRAAAVLTLPAVVFVVSFLVLPIVGIRRSEQLVVSLVRLLDADRDAVVTYVGRVPHSANFYSRKSVQKEKRLSVSAIRDHQADGHQDYFVANRADEWRFSRFVRQGELEFVLHTPKRVVYRETDESDLPISEIPRLSPLSFRISQLWRDFVRSL